MNQGFDTAIEDAGAWISVEMLVKQSRVYHQFGRWLPDFQAGARHM